MDTRPAQIVERGLTNAVSGDGCPQPRREGAAMTGIRTAVGLALALLLGVGAAQAQTSEKLVGTTGQTTSATLDFDQDRAQAFTTGPLNYTLTRVDLQFKQTGAAPPPYTMSIHEDSAGTPGTPGTSLGMLTNPASLPTGDNELAQFTTSGIDLAPNTTYWVVLDLSAASTENKIFITAADDEDPGAATGWSMTDDLLRRGSLATGWSISSRAALKLAIHGSVKPLVSNTGKMGGVDNTFANDYAQAFTTGNYHAGYTLTRVALKMEMDTATTPPAYTVSIRSDSSNAPGDTVGELTRQGSVPSTYGLVQFTSNDGIDLDPGTTYFVMIDVSTAASDTRLSGTTDDGEDTGAAAGWSIADVFRSRTAGSTGSWTNGGGDALQIAFHGSAKPFLVSNIDQADDGAAIFNYDHAQPFTTGTNRGGYTLTHVDLEMQDTAPQTPGYTVTVRSHLARRAL